MMNEGMVEVEIKGLLPTPGGAGVFLMGEDKVITIFIDAMVSRALKMILEGEDPPRPLTHDLLLSVLDGLGVSLLRVVIHDLQDEVYFARLTLEQQNELGKSVLEIDSRPSDGLVLASKWNAPVYVARHVWEASDDMRWAMEQMDPESRGGDDA